MKKLTPEEIDFIRKTGITPTVIQCDEYEKRTNKAPYFITTYEDAARVAAEQFNIDLAALLCNINNFDNSDGISLEYEATYLLYTFFDREELEHLSPSEAVKWLQDFKYYGGYRKWSPYLALCEVKEALEIYGGIRVFYETDEGDMWNEERSF